MLVGKNQRWPENRVFHRYRMQPPVDVLLNGTTVVKGLCQDIGIGGACISLSSALAVGDEVTLTIRLPDFQESLRIHSVVRNKTGNRYGFQFVSTTSRDRDRITDFGRDSTMSAFLFTPDPGIVRSTQQSLQDMGVSQVWRGSPDLLPVPNPHIVIIDSDWPDFVDVAQLLRSESAAGRIIVVGLLDPRISSKTTAEMHADIILHKPLPRNWIQRVLGTAVNLLSNRTAQKDIVWSG